MSKPRRQVAVTAALLPLLGGGAVAEELATPRGPLRGPTVLHDNGLPDLLNGYSNATSGVFGFRRGLLDDFVIPVGEIWALTRFEWTTTILHGPPAGSAADMSLWTDAGGAPGAPFETVSVTSYSEVQTGRKLFSGDETVSWIDFEPIVLPAGHYWFESAIITTDNSFWLTASPLQHDECWVNYHDLGGFQSGTEQFGVATDLSWRLFGRREVPGTWACCFADGLCVELGALDCEAQGGIFAGSGVRCDLEVCSAPGACCFPDNTCMTQSEPFCDRDGGTYAGIGVPCGGTVCNNCGELFETTVVEFDEFPGSVRLADLDGDGDLDMTVAARGLGPTGGVFISLNTGGGVFVSPVFYPVVHVERIDVADVDGDLDIDIAVTGQSPNRLVTILLNTGDGLFVFGEALVTGFRPWYVGFGDLSGDGLPELVVVNADEDDFSVWPNEGDGVFGARTDYRTGDNPRVGDFGDLDGDLNLDFAVPDQGAGTISVFLGNGDGTFAPRVAYTTGGIPAAIAIADLDGDLDLDVAVANVAGAQEALIIMLNDGDGALTRDASYVVGNGAAHLVIEDFDLDGDRDVAIPNAASGSRLSLLFNNGDASLGSPVHYPYEGLHGSHDVGDVDGDGAPDIAAPVRETVVVLFNDCPDCPADLDDSGAVDFADILAVLGAWGNAGGRQDLDGSGVVDFGDILVVLGSWGPCP